jgi:hypothetical protein
MILLALGQFGVVVLLPEAVLTTGERRQQQQPNSLATGDVGFDPSTT